MRSSDAKLDFNNSTKKGDSYIAAAINTCITIETLPIGVVGSITSPSTVVSSPTGGTATSCTR